MTTSLMRRTAVFLTLAAVSALLPATAWAAVASAPTGLTATAGNTQVVLTWVTPTSNGGETITDYIIEYSSDAGVSYGQFMDGVGTGLTVTVTGLTNGTAYLFRVSAVVNVSGQGPASSTAAATPFVVHAANDPATFSACPPGIAPPAGFTDTNSTDVDCIRYYGITNGTTATTYSPYDTVTRWQMALFLTRMAAPAGVTLGSGADQGFVDITGKSSEIQTAINQIKQLGITVGKTATTFAPDDNVTREEMALFISRFLTNATVGPGGNTELGSGSSAPLIIKSNDTDHNFTDLGNLALWETQTSVTNLWNLGVTDVQAVTTYEPTVPMTRRSMATFITNALAHTNARPSGLVLQASTYRAQGTPLVSFSVSHRTDAVAPIVGSFVDTFKFTHTLVTTTTRFDTAGKCSSTLVTLVGNIKCKIDIADPSTDSSGNMALFSEVMPSANKQDLWAWTAALATIYDNDDHAAAASKVTIETYP